MPSADARAFRHFVLAACCACSQAVAAAAGAAYATTRSDDVGEVARATGKHALSVVQHAKGARLR
jgi:hypothetical protein